MCRHSSTTIQAREKKWTDGRTKGAPLIWLTPPRSMASRHTGVRPVGLLPVCNSVALRVHFPASMSAARGCGCRGVCRLHNHTRPKRARRGVSTLPGGPADGGVCVNCALRGLVVVGAWELGPTQRTHTHTHTIQTLFARCTHTPPPLTAPPPPAPRARPCGQTGRSAPPSRRRRRAAPRRGAA